MCKTQVGKLAWLGMNYIFDVKYIGSHTGKFFYLSFSLEYKVNVFSIVDCIKPDLKSLKFVLLVCVRCCPFLDPFSSLICSYCFESMFLVRQNLENLEA